MRLYAERDQETLRARRFIKQWSDDGLLSAEQYRRLKEDTTSDLRTTNAFLRVVLLVFTLVAVAAAVGLFFVLMGIRTAGSTAGLFLLSFAVLSYVSAEIAASQAHLYRYGIEEALAISSCALFCAGLDFFLFANSLQNSHRELLLISIMGAVLSVWLWHRFGLGYAFPAGMIFLVLLPAYWTQSHAAQRCWICGMYLIGLMCIAAIRSRHRFDYLEQGYSLAKAFLWLGIYLTLNLKLSALYTLSELWSTSRPTSEVGTPFYWTTWVLLWCLPPLILAHGVRSKDRFVLAVGMIATVLTLVTNKPYLGWQRHTWDPMLLGVALVAVAVFLLRWLARGPGGVRHGFTAASVTGKHEHAIHVASAVFGPITPHMMTPHAAPPAQPQSPEFEAGFGGGSGGGGASGDF